MLGLLEHFLYVYTFMVSSFASRFLLIIRCIVGYCYFNFCLFLFFFILFVYKYNLFIYLFLSRVLLCLLHYLSYNLPVEHSKGTEMKKGEEVQIICLWARR